MGKIFEKIVTVDNALSAFKIIRRGHSEDYSMLIFESNLMANILKIVESIRDSTYMVRGYRMLVVREPKERNIYAPYLEDRLVQQMIYNIIEPYLDKKMDHYSCACRINRGVQFARNKCQRMMRLSRSEWYVKLDIDKYFASINHRVLISILEKHIRDKDAVELIKCFIENGFGDNGIPIGNLLSQLFANLYLNELDKYVRKDNKVIGYVRYMDDFICFAESRENAKYLKNSILAFVSKKLKLGIDNRKVKMQKVRYGITFLGYKIKKRKMYLSRTKIKKVRKRLLRHIESGNKNKVHHSFVNLTPVDDIEFLKIMLQAYNLKASYCIKIEALRAFSKKFNVFMAGNSIKIYKQRRRC